MKIKLTNKTQYRDDDLRAIVKAACAQVGVAAKEVRLTVVPTRKHLSVSGRATLPRSRSSLIWGRMLLRVPHEEKILARRAEEQRCRSEVWCLQKPLPTRVAQVALHEAMHLAGVQHRDMTEEQFDCTMAVPWADGLHLRFKEEAPAEERKVAAAASRLEHAQAMLTKAQTRAKRADTILKKWKRRVGALSR